MTKATRLCAATLAAGVFALLISGAFAQPSIDLSAQNVQPGTLASYLDSHATGDSTSLCYQVSASSATGGYACFEHALKLSGMTATLSGTHSVTVFAPTDAAFAQLESAVGMGSFQAFMHSPAAMKRLVDAAVVPGAPTLSDLAFNASPTSPSTSVTTTAGTPLQITFGADGYTTSRTSVDVGPSSAVDGQSFVSGTPSVFAGGSVLIPLGRIPLTSLGA